MSADFRKRNTVKVGEIHRLDKMQNIFWKKKSISKRLFITRFEEKLDGVSEADCVSLA